MNINLLAVIIGVFKSKFNRCHYNLIKYSNGSYHYSLAPHNMLVGDYIYPNLILKRNPIFSLGSVFFFYLQNVYSRFFNIFSVLTSKAIYAKAAGVFCKFIF